MTAVREISKSRSWVRRLSGQPWRGGRAPAWHPTVVAFDKLMTGDAAAATEAFEQAIRHPFPEIAGQGAVMAGRLRRGAGELDAALAAFDLATRSGHGPSAATAWVEIGRLRLERGETEAARDAYSRALAANIPAVTAFLTALTRSQARSRGQ